MTKDEIIRIAREAGFTNPEKLTTKDKLLSGILADFWVNLERFAALVAAHEREEIAEMFDVPMRLVPSAQNHHGGCLICGFTPKHAAEVIRARGQA
jgi:hypothetical protein